MTPLIEITDLGFANGNRVFAKCENMSPLSHSHYDRIYRLLFDRMPDNVHQTPEDYVFLETSSGNAGTSFARFCELYGYEGIIVFPKEVRPERLATVSQPNVRVIVSKHDGYMRGALRTLIEERRRILRDGKKAIFLDHSRTWQSARAMEPCGLEICLQLKGFDCVPNVFVSALGNGSSMSGIALGLRTRQPDATVIGFEPKQSPVISDLLSGSTKDNREYETSSLTGTGVYGISFPNFKLHLLSKIYLVEEQGAEGDDWSEHVDQVKRKYELSIGLTSAAAISVAKRHSEQVHNQTLVVVFYDIAEFYGL